MTRAVRPAASRTSVAVGLVLLALLGIGASSAGAAPAQPWLRTYMSTLPAHLVPGQEGKVRVGAYNIGDADLEVKPGHTVKMTTALPAGWTVASAIAIHYPGANVNKPCAVSGSTVTCEIREETLHPFEWWETLINVTVPAGTAKGGYAATVTTEGVEGPGGPVATPTVSHSLEVSPDPVGFGVEQYGLNPENDTGGTETQAGAHPFQLTTFLHLNASPYHFQVGDEKREREGVAGALPKDLNVDLPPGLVGDTLAVPKCPAVLFNERSPDGEANFCPKDSALGAADVHVLEPVSVGEYSKAVPVFNLEPSPGEPARFGFTIIGVPVIFDTSVNGGDFHVVVHVDSIPQDTAVLSTLLTIWGAPGDERHDGSRGVDCVAGGNLLTGEPRQAEGCKPLGSGEVRPTKAFLDMPTDCSAPILSDVSALPWSPEGAPFNPPVAAPGIQLTGCESVPFNPTMKLEGTETTASTPTGLKVVLTSPQQSTLEPGQIGEADIRNTKVVFPAGMQLSPSAGNGLLACSEEEVGFTQVNPSSGTAEFKPETAKVETPAEEKAREEAKTLCPAASKVGTVRIRTPLIEEELVGSVYLAEQEHNPYGSLFGVYIVVKDAKKSGVVVKLAGKVTPDPNTGQVTSEFADAPQAPFEELQLELFKGPRASLATPAKCGGPYTSAATLEPWSGTAPKELPAEALSFNISSGVEGSPCPVGALAFAPGFSASSASQQAGAFAPFTVVLTRAPGQQQPTNLTMTLPPGIAGMLSQVKQCQEPQANLGTCGPESLIGTASGTVGLGPDPYTEEGGRVYITGPYQGAPFGLSVVLPAKTPAFNFGNVVTRSKILVNETTAQLTISSELPTMVNTQGYPGSACSSPCKTGLPVQLRQVVVKVERPGNAPFQFNPTNCSPMSITGSISGDEGAVTPINQHFQVTGCENLPFKPEFKLETGANFTRTEGTYLKVIVKEKPGEANIAKTKIVFPEQLPSRLTTLQQACLAATFERNPALCPVHSVIGTATAHTPVLTSPLTGPVYLVSHGGAEFPDAEFILQGEGVTLLLDGKTNIHHGITSSTFESVPDAPVSTFEVNLPKGAFSAFTGFENLCKPTTTETKKVTKTVTVGKGRHKRKKKIVKTEEVKTPLPHGLVSPAILTGQNGNVINEEIKINVAECQAVQSFKKSAKHKATKRHKRKKASRRKKKH